MTIAQVLDILRDAFVVMLKISSPILLIALVIGLMISIFQATTQIQEQTLSFVPKLLAIAITLLVLGNFMINTLVGFTEKIFQIIASL